MTNRVFLAAGALSLGLAFVVASAPASAQPYGKGGNYVLSPPSRAAQQRDPNHAARDGKCACSMMKGGAAMTDQCMAMMGDHRSGAPRPGQPG